VKLYYHPISDNCRRVLATVYENGQDEAVDFQLLNLLEGQHKTPEFLAINPNGKVPTLVDGDHVLWESNAIMQYLSTSGSSLWPPNKSRYDIARWQFWAVAHWGPAIGKVVGERVIKPALGTGDPDQAVINAGLESFARFATVLDSHLDGRDWLVGDDLSLADLSVAANLTYAAPAQVDIGPYENLNDWYGRIEAREAWQKSAPPQQ